MEEAIYLSIFLTEYLYCMYCYTFSANVDFWYFLGDNIKNNVTHTG